MTGERIFASSTTRPVSGGKLAAASAAPTHSSRDKSGDDRLRPEARHPDTLPFKD